MIRKYVGAYLPSCLHQLSTHGGPAGETDTDMTSRLGVHATRNTHIECKITAGHWLISNHFSKMANQNCSMVHSLCTHGQSNSWGIGKMADNLKFLICTLWHMVNMGVASAQWSADDHHQTNLVPVSFHNSTDNVGHSDGWTCTFLRSTILAYIGIQHPEGNRVEWHIVNQLIGLHWVLIESVDYNICRDSVDTIYMIKISKTVNLYLQAFVTTYHSYSSASWPTTCLLVQNSIAELESYQMAKMFSFFFFLFFFFFFFFRQASSKLCDSVTVVFA